MQTAKTIALELGISASAVSRYIRSGDLAATRVGTTDVVDDAEAQRFIAQYRRQQAEQQAKVPVTFGQWLKRQVHRQDAVGQYAQFYMQPKPDGTTSCCRAFYAVTGVYHHNNVAHLGQYGYGLCLAKAEFLRTRPQ